MATQILHEEKKYKIMTQIQHGHTNPLKNPFRNLVRNPFVVGIKESPTQPVASVAKLALVMMVSRNQKKKIYIYIIIICLSKIVTTKTFDPQNLDHQNIFTYKIFGPPQKNSSQKFVHLTIWTRQKFGPPKTFVPLTKCGPSKDCGPPKFF